MTQRRKFSEEFKREAVGLIRTFGANVAQIAPIQARPASSMASHRYECFAGR